MHPSHDRRSFGARSQLRMRKRPTPSPYAPGMRRSRGCLICGRSSGYHKLKSTSGSTSCHVQTQVSLGRWQVRCRPAWTTSMSVSAGGGGPRRGNAGVSDGIESETRVSWNCATGDVCRGRYTAEICEILDRARALPGAAIARARQPPEVCGPLLLEVRCITAPAASLRCTQLLPVLHRWICRAPTRIPSASLACTARPLSAGWDGSEQRSTGRRSRAHAIR